MSISSPSVVVDARPEAFTFDPDRTAVIVVDMQNDFGADGGMFARAGLPIDGIKGVVEPIARVLREARRAGMVVIYLQMQFEPDLSDAGGPGAPNLVKHQFLGIGEAIVAPNGRAGRVLIRDTWNTEILSELAPELDDIVVPKHRFSGFYGTQLDAILSERNVESLVVVGCTTSVCVESTIRDAAFRDYRCLLLADCAAEPLGSEHARTNHDASLVTIEALFGWVSESSALLDALSETVSAKG
jgi:ureidoacrylate peracid hydrolase